MSHHIRILSGALALLPALTGPAAAANAGQNSLASWGVWVGVGAVFWLAFLLVVSLRLNHPHRPDSSSRSRER